MNEIDFNEERIKFGKHVLKLRQKIKSVEYQNRPISQQELADSSDYITKKTLGQIERGEVNFQFDTLLALAQVLNISLKDLLDY
ncbi:helix-turn-helix domain-containing protein [Flavobacterium quisquiliarum]|uniref:Helix-turn-helix domain-containing protein n=1 Tax=Flavobacterium quisquiliarum TaxID=1834436 RepID=A0ABV8W683_9FLAO|nr:helix-turn-helix transcriptional regulator [Flavobacterium quisquiliarum]MBW1655980.1 helix-turn-helix domain-containing protein [Flavobacterium quisquiliarum]